jgi:hypothetical protein
MKDRKVRYRRIYAGGNTPGLNAIKNDRKIQSKDWIERSKPADSKLYEFVALTHVSTTTSYAW